MFFFDFQLQILKPRLWVIIDADSNFYEAHHGRFTSNISCRLSVEHGHSQQTSNYYMQYYLNCWQWQVFYTNYTNTVCDMWSATTQSEASRLRLLGYGLRTISWTLRPNIQPEHFRDSNTISLVYMDLEKIKHWFLNFFMQLVTLPVFRSSSELLNGMQVQQTRLWETNVDSAADFSLASQRRSGRQNTDAAWRRRLPSSAVDCRLADSAIHSQSINK